MDLSAPFHLFSWMMGDVNGRPFISYLYLKGPLMTTPPTAFLPHSEQQPAEIRPNSIDVVWPVTTGLGVRGLLLTDNQHVRRWFKIFLIKHLPANT
ncbi:hypothetical protein AVEN_83734-1 [Araneus ventricosus]|uniref:Uncharacterized protein n=1 Tax=Araneus ventricosus TaxID=182803 RepID=A0A4Y2EXZ0_ARAVE|nr:hypothetical protein AVEN_83734-1 [Araneus ventricosus]